MTDQTAPAELFIDLAIAGPHTATSGLYVPEGLVLVEFRNKACAHAARFIARDEYDYKVKPALSDYPGSFVVPVEKLGD